MKPKPINEVRHLRLIPSDFDSLTESARGQYISCTHCPIAMCLKRLGYSDVGVGGVSISCGGKDVWTFGIGIDEIESARLKLLGGAKYAVIKL